MHRRKFVRLLSGLAATPRLKDRVIRKTLITLNVVDGGVVSGHSCENGGTGSDRHSTRLASRNVNEEPRW
jgi:hypothetical protein